MNTNGNGRNEFEISPLVPVLPAINWGEEDYARLQMRLDLYQDMIVARKFHQGKGGPLYVLDPLDLATVLADLTISTGLLPEGCLFWSRKDGAERIGVYVPPKVWPVSIQGQERTWRVPLPGLVFVGFGKKYGMYAVKERPAGWKVKLYNAPCPNVSGNVCTGSAPFPEASAATIWQAVEAFFTSGFNNHLVNNKSRQHPNDVLAVWRELHEARARRYPLGDLVESGYRFKDLVEG